jgi:hypothetical protein
MFLTRLGFVTKHGRVDSERFATKCLEAIA